MKAVLGHLCGHMWPDLAKWVVSRIIELVRKRIICNMQTNLRRIHEKLFKLLCPQVNVNADADDAELQLQ